jgi:hypothetical protein
MHVFLSSNSSIEKSNDGYTVSPVIVAGHSTTQFSHPEFVRVARRGRDCEPKYIRASSPARAMDFKRQRKDDRFVYFL